MGKTIIGILEGAAVLGATIIGGPIAGAAVSVGVAALNATILKPSTPKPDQVEGPIKQPVPARVSGYGRLRRAVYAERFA